MATEVKVTSRDFDGIVNPYTGEPVSVVMIVGCGPEPLFHSPDTFSTADLCGSTAELYRMWSRIGGREGLRSGHPKCAYTGESLEVAEVDGRFRFSGGFDPRVLRTRDEFLYYATMRDGKAARPAPGARDRVTKTSAAEKPSEGQLRHAGSVTPDVSEDAARIAHEAISKHRDELPLPTKVGYSGKGRRR